MASIVATDATPLSWLRLRWWFETFWTGVIAALPARRVKLSAEHEEGKLMKPTALVVAILVLSSLNGSHPSAQGRGTPGLPEGQTNDPFPQPIARDEGVITVRLREFASLPDIGGVAARMMTLVEEPASRRLFVSDMRGQLYGVSADGKTVTPYLDLTDPRWGVAVQSQGRERGMQSFVLHPQFTQAGAPGFGKLYTYTDTSNQTQSPDFTTPNADTTHDTVLLEWTARTPTAPTYDGQAPRELIRLRQPFAAQRSEGHLPARGVGPDRSGPAAQQLFRVRQPGCLPEHNDPAAQ